MTRHYCCYFDHRYLPRAIAMMRSLRRFERQSPVWVLCLDELCFRMMTEIAEPDVHLIRMQEFEEGDAALRAARADRSLIEYYFTCTPSLIRFVQQRCAAEDSVTYVDGDLFFFADPRPLHDELGAGSVSLIPHRFPDALRDRDRYGKYNVGWLTFQNDARGKAIAEWWRDRCNEWCRDELDGDRFADQKYLERFAQLFDGVVVLTHEGANVAPWNIARYTLTRSHGGLMVNGTTPLVFFHFHGLKAVGRFGYRATHRDYHAPFRGAVRRELYLPYVAELAAISRDLEKRGSAPASILSRGSSRTSQRLQSLHSQLRYGKQMLLALFRAEILFTVGGKVV